MPRARGSWKGKVDVAEARDAVGGGAEQAPTELFAKSSGGGGAASANSASERGPALAADSGRERQSAGSTPTLRAFEA